MKSTLTSRLFSRAGWLTALILMGQPFVARAELPQPEVVAEITRQLQERAVQGESVTQRISELQKNIHTRRQELATLEAAVASHAEAIGEWGDRFVLGVQEWVPNWSRAHSVSSWLKILDQLPKSLPTLPEETKLASEEDILLRSAGAHKFRCLVDLKDLREATLISQRVFDTGTSAYKQVAQALASTQHYLDGICEEFTALQNTLAALPVARHQTRQNILALWQKNLRQKIAAMTHEDLGLLRKRADSLENSWRLREEFIQKVEYWAQRRCFLSEVMHVPRWALRLARTWRYSLPGLRERCRNENIHPEVRSELEIDINESEKLAKRVLLRAEYEVEERLDWHAQHRARGLLAASRRKKITETAECLALRRRAEGPDNDQAEDAYLRFMEGCQ